MRDELTDEQRARLCVVESLIDVTTVDLDAFDLPRYAHWVTTGRNPDGGSRPLPDAQYETSIVETGSRWSPAVR